MKVIIIGNGGHSRVIQDLISELKDIKISAILDDCFSKQKIINDILYDSISSFPDHFENGMKVVIGIGDNAVRKTLADKLQINTSHYCTLIHPSAVVSKAAQIGCGTVIMPNAVINAGAEIGNHTIINTGSIVEHDNKVNHYVHLSPRATLTGAVVIKEGVHVGAGATMIPGVEIGEWSVIGAGATVIDSIPAFKTAVGCPAKVIKNTRVIGKIS